MNFRPREKVWISVCVLTRRLRSEPTTRSHGGPVDNDYQAIFYGLHRTSTMKSIRGAARPRQIALGQRAVDASTLGLIHGARCRVPRYYMARNTNPSIATKVISAPVFCHRTGRAFSRIRGLPRGRSRISGGRPSCRARYRLEQIERVFDLIHLKYLARMLSPWRDDGPYQTIDASRHDIRADHRWDLEHLLVPIAVSSRLKTLFRWNIGASCAPVYDLLCLLKVWWPVSSYLPTSSGKCSRPPRISEFQHSINNKRNTATWPRRYLISQSLLDQKFADGGQVTATHLRNLFAISTTTCSHGLGRSTRREQRDGRQHNSGSAKSQHCLGFSTSPISLMRSGIC